MPDLLTAAEIAAMEARVNAEPHEIDDPLGDIAASAFALELRGHSDLATKLGEAHTAIQAWAIKIDGEQEALLVDRAELARLLEGAQEAIDRVLALHDECVCDDPDDPRIDSREQCLWCVIHKFQASRVAAVQRMKETA